MEASETWQRDDTDLFIAYGDAFVPRRAEQIGAVVDLVADLPSRRVLDLCCGQGLLSEAYLRRYPDGRVTLLDGSREMLDDALARLADHADRVTTVQARIEDTSWRRQGAFGGVFSSLAVHHLDGPGKQVLYRDICSLLEPGGVFAMADLVEPRGAKARTLAGDHWEAGVAAASREAFGDDRAVEAFTRAEWNYYRLPGPDPVDQPSSVVEHLTWLTEAGFVDVDVVWLYAGHAIFTARKPAPPPGE